MEQRKLNDQAKTLVDLAKISLGSQALRLPLVVLSTAHKPLMLQEESSQTFFFFPILGPHLWQMEFPRLGVKSEL